MTSSESECNAVKVLVEFTIQEKQNIVKKLGKDGNAIGKRRNEVQRSRKFQQIHVG